MGCVTLWVTCLALCYYNGFGLRTLKEDRFSSLAVSQVSWHEANFSKRRASSSKAGESIISSQKTGSFLPNKLDPPEILSTESQETFDGFEFVDSPDDGPSDSIEVNRGVDVVNSGGNPESRSGDARVDNSWKSYVNGTIIHDVHISLVHPANMLGIVNGGDLHNATNNPVDFVSNSKNITSEERASLAPVLDVSIRDAINSTVASFNSNVENSSAAPNNTILSINDSELPPATNTSSHTTLGSATPEENANASFVAAILLDLENPVITQDRCFIECLANCFTKFNPNSTRKSLPSCPPLLSDSTKEKLVNHSGETSPSVASLQPLSEMDMLKTKESPETRFGFLLEDICLSESCILKAADVLRRMETSADPCDSFYKFACGGYIKNEIPDGKSSRSIFSDISSDIVSRMYSVLKTPLVANDSPSVKLLKIFYGKCILTSAKELFMDAVKELGGWPSSQSYNTPLQVPPSAWGDIAFNSTYGMHLENNLVSINLTIHEDKWLLNVDYPEFVKMALNSDSSSVLDDMKSDVERVASALGIDNTTMKRVLADLKIFMASAIKYAKTTMSSAKKGLYSLKDLSSKFIHIDIIKKLPLLLKEIIVINDNETVYVGNMMYLKKIDDHLRDSTVRTQANHVVLTALRSLSILIGSSTDNDQLFMTNYCVKLTGKLFPQLFGHLYSSTFVSNSRVASSSKIVFQIRDSLLDVLSNGNADQLLIDTINKLTFIWSYRNDTNDDLKAIAKSFDKNQSFLGLVRTGIWNLKKITYIYLHQTVNSSLPSLIERYSEDVYGVNAFYYLQHVVIPSSALHENIFDPDLPAYVGFGGLGFIVGHELFHSILSEGGISKTNNYRIMGSCIIDQFDNFTKRFSDGRLEGVYSKYENIADYGGFKVAYRAFLDRYDRSSRETKEKRLPGLQKFNDKQMFWLTSATNWCRKISPNFQPSSIDRHAPPEFRIDGQLANMPEFAEDFNCPENSPMNPKERCSLW